jgi:hypothetical protein
MDVAETLPGARAVRSASAGRTLLRRVARDPATGQKRPRIQSIHNQIFVFLTMPGHAPPVRGRKQTADPGSAIGEDRLPRRGTRLALEPEVITMRWKPWSVTLQVKKTRTGWVLAVRVNFAS